MLRKHEVLEPDEKVSRHQYDRRKLDDLMRISRLSTTYESMARSSAYPTACAAKYRMLELKKLPSQAKVSFELPKKPTVAPTKYRRLMVIFGVAPKEGQEQVGGVAREIADDSHQVISQQLAAEDAPTLGYGGVSHR